MLVSLFLVLLALGFYAFIAFSPKEVVQLGLASMWVLLIIALIAGAIFSP